MSCVVPPGQNDKTPVIVGEGTGIICVVTLVLAVQLFPSVTVTVNEFAVPTEIV